MSKSVYIHNNLTGQTLSRDEIEALIALSDKEKQPHLVAKFRGLLVRHPKQMLFKFNSVRPLKSLGRKPAKNKVIALNGFADADMLHGIPCYDDLKEYLDVDLSEGLNAPVAPEEIYQMITDKVLELIEKGDLAWRKPWKSVQDYGIAATNYISKSPYRGINSILLNFIWPALRKKEWDLPYFLTFKQIEAKKGKLKKGSKAYQVVYFNRVYSYSAEGLSFRTGDRAKFTAWAIKNQSKIPALRGSESQTIAQFVNFHAIPFLKYYNVFNADDIEGIDWKIKKIDPKAGFSPIESAELIIQHFPDPPSFKEGGDSAHYIPSKDHLQMPFKTDFNSEQEYYSTYFHELVHSTGHPKRLGREMSGGFGSEKYAFEELIAELGSSYLCGESGILFHTINNSAAYLKGWRKRLIKNMEEDNRFFFRAASKGQAAADFILDRNSEGVPAYMVKKPKTAKPAKKAGAKRMKVDAKGQGVLFGPASWPADLDSSSIAFLETAINKGGLKSPEKAIKTARKIAKLEGKNLALIHVAEGIQYYMGTPTTVNDPTYMVWLDGSFDGEIVNYERKKQLGILTAADKKARKLISTINGAITKRLNELDLPAGSITEVRKSFQGKVLESETLPKAAKEVRKIAYPVKNEVCRNHGRNLSKSKSAKVKSSAAAKLGGKTCRGKKKEALSGPVDDAANFAEKVVNGINKCQKVVDTARKIPAAVKNLVTPLSQAGNIQKPREVFNIPGQIGRFIGPIERKPTGSVVMTLDAPQGSGKTRLFFQMMNAVARGKHRTLFASLEEHKDSNLFVEKRDLYVDPENMDFIDTVSELPDGINTLYKLLPYYDVVFIDSAQKLGYLDVDDLRKRYDGKLIVIIFQRTKDGGMRGGSAAGFDADLVAKFEKMEDFRQNYAYWDKNRYMLDEGIKYNVFHQKTFTDIPIKTTD